MRITGTAIPSMLSYVKKQLFKNLWSDYPKDQDDIHIEDHIVHKPSFIIIHKSELYSYIIIPDRMTDTKWEQLDAAETILKKVQGDLDHARREWPGYPDQVQIDHAAATVRRAARSINNILTSWQQHPRTKAFLSSHPESLPEATLEATYSDQTKATYKVRLGTVNFLPESDVRDNIKGPVVTTQGSVAELEEWLDEEVLRVETCLSHLPRILIGSEIDKVLHARREELRLLADGFDPSNSTVIHTTRSECPITVKFVGR